ncbi:hemolysin family protein [Nocardioides sp. Kera G14]|uniref:hemolysin family protein n=1 Tax=Nocardioides sp. Kera G14 TaxID=2884264 RepID=UPI001D12C07E|nr:hemolysin family protein [Nocardioides sp. Kera G14]UDY25251.1 hemolysin family protein [Nocardioides sp. Kera G14]
MSAPVGLLLTVLLLLGNAFFVATEFALISSRRSQIEPLAQEGSALARLTLQAMEQISSMVAGIQLGVTVCSVLLGAVAEPSVSKLVEPVLDAVHAPHGLLHPISFVVALAVVAFFHVVLGEMVPKNVTLAGPERAVLILGPAMLQIVRVLRPLIVALDAIASLTLRLLRIERKEELESTYTLEQVAVLVEESHGEGLLEADEYDRLSGALGFTEKSVSAIVLPIDRLTTVPRGASGAEVEERCGATGFSRFPVLEGGDLVGYLHIKDVLEPDAERRARPIDPKWIRPLASVHPDDSLHEALETLQRRGAHMARVVDHEGRTLGVATLEDVIEELVGEIRDAAHGDTTLTP